MKLNEIPQRKNRIMKAKRIGRGYGSGKGGHTVGKGQKGQKSRSGGKTKLGFEGGKVPLFRKLPKFRGFRNPTRVEYQVINFADLEKNFKIGEEVSVKILREKGMIRKKTKDVKILGKGKLTKKLKFKDVKISAKANIEVEKLNKK
ncbi:MAG: 50S ribosomal protein L15 [bacterium]